MHKRGAERYPVYDTLNPTFKYELRHTNIYLMSTLCDIVLSL